MAPNKILRFGELSITMTSEIDDFWKGGPKGARPSRRDLEIKRPRIVPETDTPANVTELRPLGDVAFSTEGSKYGKYGALLVGYDRTAIADSESPPLKEPLYYDLVFNGADEDKKGGLFSPVLHVWRAVPPEGYECLGDVSTTRVVENTNIDPPGSNNKHPIWCVRKDLVTGGKYSSSSVWDSNGSSWPWSSIWDIQPGSNLSADEEGWFPLLAGTFRAQTWNLDEPNLKMAGVLRVPLDKTLVGFPATAPVYEKGNPPVEGTLVGKFNHGTAVLPYIAFFWATDKQCLDYIDNPFWRLSKGARFRCFKVYNNAGPSSRDESTEFSMGVSTEESNTIAEQAGVSITASVGIKALGGGIDTTLNYSFTQENTSSHSEYREYKETRSIHVPAWCISVLWTKNLEIVAQREDGERTLSRLITDANVEPWQTGEELLHGASDGRSGVTVGERMFEKRIPLD